MVIMSYNDTEMHSPPSGCNMNNSCDVKDCWQQGSKLTFLLGSTGAPNFKKLGAPTEY